MTLSLSAPCPCGSQKTYASCCGAYHSGERVPTAEALMRARYSAYAACQIEFIEKTTHPKILKEFDFNASKEWAEKSKWLELKILKTTDGGPNDHKGTVDFEAHFEINGKKEIYSEHAQFERSGPKEAWYFYDGKPIGSQPIVKHEAKPARNLPCPCGSGQKYKRCCGK